MTYVYFITAVVAGLFLLAVNHYGAAWLKTRAGKGVLAGLIGAPLVAIFLSLLAGCSALENKRAGLFVGIEGTKNQSPQCEKGGASDRLTSNLGLKACGDNGGDEYCVVYRHHSCAITPDRESYDAFGIEATKWFEF
jgi:hypothetical protein